MADETWLDTISLPARVRVKHGELMGSDAVWIFRNGKVYAVMYQGADVDHRLQHYLITLSRDVVLRDFELLTWLDETKLPAMVKLKDRDGACGAVVGLLRNALGGPIPYNMEVTSDRDGIRMRGTVEFTREAVLEQLEPAVDLDAALATARSDLVRRYVYMDASPCIDAMGRPQTITTPVDARLVPMSVDCTLCPGRRGETHANACPTLRAAPHPCDESAPPRHVAAVPRWGVRDCFGPGERKRFARHEDPDVRALYESYVELEERR